MTRFEIICWIVSAGLIVTLLYLASQIDQCGHRIEALEQRIERLEAER